MTPGSIDRTYTMRSGLAKGLRKHGGLGLRQTLGLWKSPSPEEDAFLQGLDLDGATVYDIGAFEGMHAVFFASRVGPAGRVLSFEPVPANRERLQANVAVNGFERRVQVHPKAVGGEVGTLVVHAIEGEGGLSSADPGIASELRERGAATLEVPVTTVDAVVAEGAPPPDFVKIDVEGLEADVLRGARQTLAEHRPRLFIELHGSDAASKAANAGTVAALLLAAGYRLRHVESGTPVDSAAEAPAEGHLHAAP